MTDLLMLRLHSGIAIATIALILWLRVALALAQDKEFAPRMKPASFTVDQVLAKMEERLGNKV